MLAEIVEQHRLGVAHVSVLPVQVVLFDLLKVSRYSIQVFLRSILVGVEITLQDERVFTLHCKLVFLKFLTVLCILIHIEANAAYE